MGGSTANGLDFKVSVVETGFELRKYGENRFLMSRRAAERIPPEDLNGGVCAVVETRIGGESYFLIVSDNKKYWGNVAGGVENGESDEEAMVRELKEEVGIKVQRERLKKVGSWTYMFKNELFGSGYSKLSGTNCFYVFVEWEKFDLDRFLVPEKGWSDPMPDVLMIEAKKTERFLNEIEMLSFVRGRNVDEVSQKLYGKQFDGHHRELIRIFSGVEKSISKSFP